MWSRGTAVSRIASRICTCAGEDVVGRAVAAFAVDAEAGGGIALRIEIDDQHVLADGRERGAEIDGGCGLADAALLVGEGEDPGNRRQVEHGGCSRRPDFEKRCYYRYLTLGDATHEDDAPVRIGLAGDQLGLDSPRFRGCGQFSLYILSLWKHTDATPFQQRICVGEEPVERRQRAGRHHIEGPLVDLGKVLNSLRVHNGRDAQSVGAVAQEVRLLSGCSRRGAPPRRACPRARRRSRGRGSRRRTRGRSSAVAPGAEREELERVGDVTGPDVRQRRARPRGSCAADT